MNTEGRLKAALSYCELAYKNAMKASLMLKLDENGVAGVLEEIGTELFDIYMALKSDVDLTYSDAAISPPQPPFLLM